jgi:GTP-binding protein EngB required for normal cell division
MELVRDAYIHRQKLPGQLSFRYTIVLTKLDKLKGGQRMYQQVYRSKVQEIEKVFHELFPTEINQPVLNVIATSATEKYGIDRLWSHILNTTTQ